jgi:hypothetical protein
MRSSRANAASTEIGIGSASSMTSPSTAVISCWPRLGSGSRNTKNAATAAGNPRTRNGTRQPFAPPASVAIPPTTSGLSAPMTLVAIMLTADSRPRTPIG